MMTEDVKNIVQTKLRQRSSFVVFGIESHVCVQQTALDLKELKHDVHIVADAVSSRNKCDTTYSLERMRQSGCFITTFEAVIFDLLRDYSHPHAREIINLVKD
ncbi:Isochorismatase family protein 1B [Thelohanellus kitauei]|uniref:Isochorismatase family protein 1B n=1 Tax=Thelohanellus kitauei TaxID=669202 RepID=A0A0C2MX06_THEKT|nr:Isochorismatase family protein 1B [Thelohanellus kitauei]